MGPFNRDSRSGGGRSFGGGGRSFGGGGRSFGGGGRSFGGRDSGPRQMHKAVCGKCGNDCEVPFRPTGERPVFCSSCFDQQEGGSAGANRSGGRFERRESFGGRSSSEDRQMHETTCAKCGNKCSVPFKPMAGKPVYCDSCFGKGGNPGSSRPSAGGDQYKDQLNAINVKLDKVMKALGLNVTETTMPEKKLKKETPLVSPAAETVVEKKDKVSKEKAKPAKKVAAKKVVAKKKK